MCDLVINYLFEPEFVMCFVLLVRIAIKIPSHRIPSWLILLFYLTHSSECLSSTAILGRI
jgi:hypothetical protein